MIRHDNGFRHDNFSKRIVDTGNGFFKNMTKRRQIHLTIMYLTKTMLTPECTDRDKISGAVISVPLCPCMSAVMHCHNNQQERIVY